MNDLTALEQAFLDQAFTTMSQMRSTCTENQALQAAREHDLSLSLDSDPEQRFLMLDEQPYIQSDTVHYILQAHILANAVLLYALQEGQWDGKDLEHQLAQLDQEEGGHHVFCPLDQRLQWDRHKQRWELRYEHNRPINPAQRHELDAYLPFILARWHDRGNQPCTLSAIIEIMRQHGYPDHYTHQTMRSWLLDTTQIQRVGENYWLPSEQHPPEIGQLRYQVLPIRSEHTTGTDGSVAVSTAPKTHGPRATHDQEITSTQVDTTHIHWRLTLLFRNQQGGFLQIPAPARKWYPPLYPGQGAHNMLHCDWHHDGSHFWLWHDRQRHFLLGTTLQEKLWELELGSQLHIDWYGEGINIQVAGIDEEVQQEEARFVDSEELQQLRHNVGESYRASIQAILAAAPEGLTFPEIYTALCSKQQHTVKKSTARTTLNAGGFLRQGERWFAAPGHASGQRSLRRALLDTLLPPQQDSPDTLDTIETPARYVQKRARAIHQRLTEINALLQSPP